MNWPDCVEHLPFIVVYWTKNVLFSLPVNLLEDLSGQSWSTQRDPSFLWGCSKRPSFRADPSHSRQTGKLDNPTVTQSVSWLRRISPAPNCKNWSNIKTSIDQLLVGGYHPSHPKTTHVSKPTVPNIEKSKKCHSNLQLAFDCLLFIGTHSELQLTTDY